MPLSTARLRSIVESMLLVSAEPVPIGRIIEVVRGEDRSTEVEAIKAAIGELIADYARPDRPLAQGFRVEDVGGGLQLRTVPANAAFLRRFLALRPQRLTKAALETLAIVAYRQPVTKPEIEKIRGVDVGATLKALLDRDLVRIIGKKDEVGRPLLYGTTKAFLELFGLKSLSALPTLREYSDLDEDHQKQVDELYEEERVVGLSDLAAKAKALVEPEHDPDLDRLEVAVRRADAARKASTEAIDGKPAADDETETPPDGAEPAGPEPAGG